MRLSDWQASSRAAVVGRWMARGGAYLGLMSGIAAPVYLSFYNQAPFLLIALIAIAPGILITAAGLLLVVRNGTYRGSGRVQWWNWLLWRI